MPIEACIALVTFQMLMNLIFHDFIKNFVMMYIDDLPFTIKDEQSQYPHLETVLSRLEKNKLNASQKKLEFIKE